MKTKLTLYVAVIAVALFGTGCSSLDKGLVAYYPFNGNAKDESGNGNDGEVKGATLTTDQNNKANSAYRFNGKDNILLPRNVLGKGAPLTMSIWVKTLSVIGPHSYARLIGSCAAERTYWQTGITLDSLSEMYFEAATDQSPGEAKAAYRNVLPFQEWFHTLLVYDGENIIGYLNGEKVASAEAKGDFRTVGYVAIGGGDGPPPFTNEPWFFNGVLDNARIYNRALSAAEVKALYELEKP